MMIGVVADSERLLGFVWKEKTVQLRGSRQARLIGFLPGANSGPNPLRLEFDSQRASVTYASFNDLSRFNV